jgi:hypothetical protein
MKRVHLSRRRGLALIVFNTSGPSSILESFLISKEMLKTQLKNTSNPFNFSLGYSKNKVRKMLSF